jgi:hypothetical protein
MKIEDFKKKKNSSIKFHQNPASGSLIVPCGQTEERTDMKKLIVIFRNSANAPKNCEVLSSCSHLLMAKH